MSIRRYCFATGPELSRLAGGEPMTLRGLQAASDDEADEYDALLAAAELGGDQAGVVVTAIVANDSTPVEWTGAESLHVDVDGSGDLSWYDPSEVDAVLDVVRAGR